MKLTKADRDAFVRAVMDDVPATDYKEEARRLVTTAMRESLPPKIRAIWDDKALRHFIRQDAVFGLGDGLGYVYLPNIDVDRTKVATQLDELRAAYRKQEGERSALRAKVSAMVTSCTTLKQAAERLPEFAKYLPANRDGTADRSMPVVANVVDDLVKAGWPKGKK